MSEMCKLSFDPEDADDDVPQDEDDHRDADHADVGVDHDALNHTVRMTTATNASHVDDDVDLHDNQ